MISFLLLISCRQAGRQACMHACMQSYMFKQFCIKESKFSCRKHSKENSKFAQKIFHFANERKTHTHKELKIRLVAYEPMKTNHDGSFYFFFFLLRSCTSSKNSFHLHLCNSTAKWIRRTVDFLLLLRWQCEFWNPWICAFQRTTNAKKRLLSQDKKKLHWCEARLWTKENDEVYNTRGIWYEWIHWNDEELLRSTEIEEG